MDASTEIELIDELRDLDARGEKYLDDSVETSSIDRYMSAERFAEEEAALFLFFKNACVQRERSEKKGLSFGARAHAGAFSFF